MLGLFLSILVFSIIASVSAVNDTNASIDDGSITSCKNLYWFDDTTKVCGQKQFCGMYMYLGLQTFNTKTQCEKALNETCIEKDGECCKGEICDTVLADCLFGYKQVNKGCDKNCFTIVECVKEKTCPNNSNEENNKCYKTLSNGRKAEIKIMPDTASATAIARLGDLGFTIELKEVGKGDDVEPVYELTGNKQGKFLGIFKIMTSEIVQVDAETGEVKKVIKPWWSFLASGI